MSSRTRAAAPGRPLIRFGHTAFPTMSSRQAWTDTVRRARDVGCTALTVTDHFGSSGGIWSALVAAHDAAPDMRVGTLMVNNDLWNPAVLARESITTDVLTDGALELGVGAGWSEPDYRAAGIPRDAPAVRVARFAEAIEILERAFRGDLVEHHGRYYDLKASGAWPRPRQDPMPLVIGGGGRRVLELAARHATTVSVHRNLQEGTGAASWQGGEGRSHPEQVTERIGWIRAAAGDRFPEIELHALILKAVITDRRESAAADLGKPLGMSAADVLGSPHFLVGTVDQVATDLVERRARWGFTYWTVVQAADLEPLGPVIARLAGT
jgi:probable F420-dependent oxidoreductase